MKRNDNYINIVIASNRPWTKKMFEKTSFSKKYKYHLISDPRLLNSKSFSILKPKYIFFPHWSWKIPSEIYENYECIGFHMTDLPYGRGGSPLQNLIINNIKKTKISAMKIVKDFDAGDIYMKKSFDISYGSAQEIYERATQIVFLMIKDMLNKQQKSSIQSGKVVVFKRRTPIESKIPKNLSGKKLYDFIRMLDAEDYPNAFMEVGNQRFEFKNATIKNNLVEASAVIKKIK